MPLWQNYTGDRLNFGLAAEEAKSEGYKVEVDVMDVSKESNTLTWYGSTSNCYTCRWLLLEMIVLFHPLEVLLEGEAWQGQFLSTRFFFCYLLHTS